MTFYRFFEDLAFLGRGCLKLFLTRFLDVCRLIGVRFCRTRLGISYEVSVISSIIICYGNVFNSSTKCVFDFFSGSLNC